MNCQRARVLLEGFSSGRIAPEADELDELIRTDLVVELDRHAFVTLQQAARLARAYSSYFRGASGPLSVQAMQKAQQALRKKLQSGWFRFWRSRARLRQLEFDEVALRSAMSALSDPDTAASLDKLMNHPALLPPGASFVAYPRVGTGLFAVTQLGMRVGAALVSRMDRIGNQTLKAFVWQYAKVEAKAEAFAQNVRTLWQHVGELRKGKAHVVVGLAKANLPVAQAAELYTRSLAQTQSPHVAVTFARHAAVEGGAAAVGRKLALAHQALCRTGLADAPALRDAAKSLLPFASLDAGAVRFSELFVWLRQNRVVGDERYKFAARLVSAQGSPVEVQLRVQRAARRLAMAVKPARSRSGDVGKAAVVLASLVSSEEAVDGLCDRFLEIERAMAARWSFGVIEELALECVSSRGTPREVVSTVEGLAKKVAGGAEPNQDHLTIAAAFAKRFAF